MLEVILSLILLYVSIYYLNKWYRKDFLEETNNKHVFITGTDTGFGKLLALDLDSKGIRVYAGCYTEKGAKELKENASDRLKIVQIDVTDKDSINKAKELIISDLPPEKGLWGLVNNAGIIGNMCFDLTTYEHYKKVLDVNFFGHIMVTETFLPLVKKARGRIVTLISIFGRGSSPVTAYSCSKFALEPYCDSLRRSAKTFGVHASILEPGYFPSTQLLEEDAWTSEFNRSWDNLSPDIKQEYGEEFKESFVKGTKETLSCWPLAKYNNALMVIEAIEHGLFAKHPKARYMVGYGARPFVILASITPDWMMDWTVRRVLGYHKVMARV